MIKNSRNERGVALLMVLITLVLLTGIGLGLMYMTDTETGINSNFRAEMQAYYASKAGLEEGRERLRQYAPNAITPPAVMPSTTNAAGVIYIINSMGASDPVQPWSTANRYFDDELCHENYTGLGLGTQNTPDIPCTSAPSGTYYTTVNSTDPATGTTSATPYKWVRITLKQVGSAWPYCVDGPASLGGCTAANFSRQACATVNGVAPYNPQYYETPLPTVGSPVPTICEQANMRSIYDVVSLSVTPTGSRKMTEYEVSSIVLPPLPGAITFDGQNPDWDPPNSNAFQVTGNDIKSCGPGSQNVPAVGAYDDPAKATLIDDASKRASNYTGPGGSPSVLNVNSQLGVLATVGGLQTLVTNITYSADQVFGNNPSSVNLGSNTNPLITVVNGDYDMGNVSGAGLLLVTGKLTMSGNPSFNGIILLIGKGSILYNGSGNGTINGAIFVANLYNSSGSLLPASSAPGVPAFDWKGAGNLNLNYDSCWMNNLSNRAVLRVLASHEELY